MTKKEISKLLGINQNTIKNWERNRPLLYKIVMEYFSKNKNTQENEIIKYYNQLDDEEKELYLAEIKSRVLRKKLNNKG